MLRSIVKSLGLLSIVVLLTACGGGGGSTGSDGSSSASANGSATGFVTVLASDDDIQDFDQAIFDISRITLIGGESGQITIFDEMRSIDFLALETVNEVLAEAEVPVGSYSKIRFQVDRITLKALDDSQNVVREENVRILANGKVDVVPRSDFEVGADQSVVLAIDIDLQKSLKLIQTGTGRFQFRPVIFANILSLGNPGGLVRIEGEFEAVERDGVRRDDRFKLCDADLMSDDDTTADSPNCRLVLLAADTGVLGIDMDRLVTIDIDDIANGDRVVSYGRLQLDSVLDELAGTYGIPLLAQVIASGQFQRFEGTGRSAFEAIDETFTLELAASQGIAGDLNVETRLPLSQGAKLFYVDGSPAPASAIADGAAVEVEGLLVLSTANRVDAFIAIVDPDTAETVIVGMPTAIDLVSQALTVIDDDGVAFCVRVDQDTLIQQLVEMDDAIETAAVDLSVLSDATVEVTGTVDVDDGCIVASAIVITSNASVL